MSSNLRKETDCLNCGNEVTGNFCSVCGQKNTVHPESFGRLMLHYFEDLTHYEGNLLKSSWILITKPGYLTNVYNAGQRIRFINPLRMYIFISLITFTYLFFTIDLSSLENQSSLNGNVKLTGFDQLSTKKDSLKSILIDSSTLKMDSVAGLNLNQIRDSINKGIAKTSNKIKAKQSKKDSLEKDDGALSFTPEELKPDSNDGYFKRKIKKTIKGLDEGFEKNPKDFLKAIFEKYLHNLPKSLFVCMPIFALLLALFYYPKKRYFTEQIIFTLHFHIVILLCILVILLMGHFVNEGWVIFLLFIYIIFYLYKALKNVFKESRFLTIIKSLCIFFIYYIVVLIVQVLFLIYAAADSA